jgi:3-deoxy-D-arabino-heptulosonate 7-phosphate (DAHP) synthase
MTRRELDQKRDGLEAQMHWAALHDADQELLDLLRVENDRLLVTIGPGRTPGSAISSRHGSRRGDWSG